MKWSHITWSIENAMYYLQSPLFRKPICCQWWTAVVFCLYQEVATSRSFHPVSLFDNLGVGHLLPAFPPVEDPCHCTAQGSDSSEHLPPAGLGSKYSRWVLSFDSWPQKT